MVTCLADAVADDVARATVEVLEAAGCRVHVPADQTCCGQPPFNAGDWDGARRLLTRTADVFAGETPVVTPSASCAAMLRHGARLATEGRPEAETTATLGQRTHELTAFLVGTLGITRWPGRYPAQVVLHDSCHGRGTPTPGAARTLLDSLDGLTRVEIDAPEPCCGFGGAFSVAFPSVSAAIGRRKRAAVATTTATEVLSTDASCLMHLGGLRAPDAPRFRHVAQVLRDALDHPEPAP